MKSAAVTLMADTKSTMMMLLSRKRVRNAWFLTFGGIFFLAFLVEPAQLVATFNIFRTANGVLLLNCPKLLTPLKPCASRVRAYTGFAWNQHTDTQTQRCTSDQHQCSRHNAMNVATWTKRFAFCGSNKFDLNICVKFYWICLGWVTRNKLVCVFLPNQNRFMYHVNEKTLTACFTKCFVIDKHFFIERRNTFFSLRTKV